MIDSDSNSGGKEPEPITPHLTDSTPPHAADEPSEVDFAEWLAAYDEALSTGAVDLGDHPDSSIGDDPPLATELNEAKECLRLLEQIWPRTPSSRSVIQSRPGQDPSSLNADAAASQPAAPEGEHGIVRFGRFQIVRELGHGGGGIVYLAQDPKLDRQVALKVPRPEFVFTPTLRRRFLREARAAAAPSHPHIVPVYETGQEGPICYIVAAFCPGTNLATWLNQRRQPIDARSAAQLIAVLAEAVDYAHRLGVLHRDLKPSNVLLELSEETATRDSAGESSGPLMAPELCDYVPKLTDFGLAKLLEREGDETRTGAVLGTPAYMAPEQAVGRAHEVGPATDVYALGVILYQLLTGRRPFQGDSDLQTLSQVVNDLPRPVHGHRRGVPRDLEAICLKCLEKQAGRRYLRAVDLADDLHRFLAGESTEAKPAKWPARALKWSKRRPTAAALIAVSLLSSLILGTGAAWHVFSVRRVQEVTATIEQEAQESREQVRRHDYANYLQGAYQAWQNADVASALELLERCRPSAGQRDSRGFEWYYVRRLCDGGFMSLNGHNDRVRGADFSPDGRVLATCADDGWIRLWDPITGRVIASLDHDGVSVHAVRLSRDGRWLASAEDDGHIRLWDASTHQLLRTLEGHTGAVLNLAFSQDGSTLATAGADKTIRVWDVDSGRHRLTLEGHHEAVHSVALGPDGNTLVSGSADQTIKVWDLRSPGDPVKTIQDQSPVYAVAISPDGQTLAAGGLLRLWDLAGDGEPITLVGHQNHVRSIAFSPGGETLVSAGDDMTVRTWNLATRTSRYVYRGHTGPIYTAAFSPQGNVLATVGADRTVRLWDPTAPPDRRRLSVKSSAETLVDFSPLGHTLALVTLGNTGSEARIWSLTDGKDFGILRRPMGLNGLSFSSLAFSPDGRRLAVTCHPGPVLLCDAESPAEARVLDDSSSKHSHCTFSPNGRQLIVAGIEPESVRVYDVGTGEKLAQLPGQRCAAFSHDGRLVAMESVQSLFAVELWDWVAKRRVGVLPGHGGEIYQIVFSDDGRLLASASEDSTVRLWNVEAKALQLTLRGHTQAVYDAAFCPRGQSLATAGAHGTVKFWDLQTGRLLLSLNVGSGPVESIAFSPDGQRLATSVTLPEAIGQVDLWDAPDRGDFPNTGQ